MKFKNVILTVFVVMLAACSEAPVSVEEQFVDDVAAALGGRNAIEAADTLTMEAEGRMLNVGQDLTPEAATMEFDISEYRLVADLANNRSRTGDDGKRRQYNFIARTDVKRGHSCIQSSGTVTDCDGVLASDSGSKFHLKPLDKRSFR